MMTDKKATELIRDRVKEFRRIPANELIPNPKNWRTHPDGQRKALQGILTEVGFAGAELARETPDGIMLIDGALRRETMGTQPVPVLITDLTEAEADLLLAVFDPIAAMAGADKKLLEQLLDEIQTSDDGLADLLTQLAEDNDIIPIDEDPTEPPDGFKEVDENIETNCTCPKCGFSWSAAKE